MKSVIETPYWWWDSAISPEICNGIIAQGNRMELNIAGIKDSKTINEKYRTTDVGFFQEGPIHAITSHYVHKANVSADWNFNIVSSELVQFGKYMPGAFYKEHTDSDVKEFSNRKLSISVQLSAPENYSGGDFRLKGWDGDPCLMPPELKNQGTVIVFPSMLLHEITRVRAGIRYSLVQWHSSPESE